MPIISTYSVSLSPLSTLSRWYSDIDEVLIGLPDNTNNAIQAINIRDAVYSLYEYTNLIVSSFSATSSIRYDRSTASYYLGNVGGVLPSTSFNGTVQDVLDSIFYPYVPPSSSIQPLGDREFGSSLLVTLNWSVVKNSNIITTIFVNGVSQVVTGSSQSGVYSANVATHSVTPLVSETNSFVVSVSDGITTSTSSTTLTWLNRVYWGSVDLSTIGNPNLTTNPGSASLVASLCTDSVIYNLSGANANGSVLGSKLSNSKSNDLVGIDAAGDYLIFAWPSNVLNPYSPSFVVNGINNTAFTRVRTNSPFTNQWGFSGTNYEVWVTNTRQFSPLNIIII